MIFINLLHEVIVNKGYNDINPVQFGYENCQPSHHFGPALRTHWLLHYVVSGKGYFKIEGREYTVTAGNIFVIPPFVETYYEADTNDPWSYIWIGFTKADKINIEFDDVMYIPNVHRVFEDMKKCSGLSTGRTEFLCSKIWQLISLIYDKQNDEADYINKAVSMINSEYMSNISVQSIADRIGLERTYFSDLFKKKIGISPKQFLLKTRMEQAAVFIRDYGYSVSVTALSVGYSDVYTFSKMFKQYFGISPSKY